MRLEVLTFNKRNFSKFFGSPSAERRDYFFDYLSHVEAKTILVEYDYIDRDYLKDYAGYYSRCFTDYKRTCNRLHFFGKDFDRDFFAGCLNQSKLSDKKAFTDLRSSYLGFMVIKPLPVTKIGRTCLCVYKDHGAPRKYPTTRIYNVNLFGLELKIESLAFQEQDHEVAACATTAVWVLAQKTAELFESSLYSPSEITKMAVNSDNQGRIFPSGGLNARQICQAVRGLGLELEFLACDNMSSNELRSFLYSYLSYGTPILLGFEIPGSGLHAVTIAGYSMRDRRIVYQDKGVYTSDHLSKLYVHDDGLGPFSKYFIDDSMTNGFPAISSQQWHNGGVCPARIAIAPLYHKVRVSWSEMRYEKVDALNLALSNLLNNLKSIQGLNFNYDQLCWDLRLTDVKKFKKSVARDFSFLGRREDVLLTSFPRYLWQVDLYVGFGGNAKVKVMTMVFDATALQQDYFNLHSVYFYSSIALDLLKLLKFIGHKINSVFISELVAFIVDFESAGFPAVYSSSDGSTHSFLLYSN